MKINEIAPKFEEIDERLGSLESMQHSHEDDEEASEVVELPEGVPTEISPESLVEEPESADEETPDEEVSAEEGSDPPVEEDTEEEVDIDTTRFHTETQSAATPDKVDSVVDNTDLKDVIAADVKPYKVAEVINAAMNHPMLRNARELVMKPETGQMEKVQSFRLTDGTFMVPSREVFERVVLETKIDEVEWVKDVTDCEDISLRFNARCIELGLNSCGRVMSWSGGHCFIIAIVRDEDSLGFVFLEPQTDQFLTDEVGEGQYSLENCLILIN